MSMSDLATPWQLADLPLPGTPVSTPKPAASSPAPATGPHKLPPHLEEYGGKQEDRHALMAWKLERELAAKKVDEKNAAWLKEQRSRKHQVTKGVDGKGERKGCGRKRVDGRGWARRTRRGSRNSAAANAR
eukprot:43895-Chlamydomonas_euryale.AAC.12